LTETVWTVPAGGIWMGGGDWQGTLPSAWNSRFKICPLTRDSHPRTVL